MYSITSLTIWVGDDKSRFDVGDAKGPSINAVRGHITRITRRKHESGAEFSIYVSNNSIDRLWVQVSSNHYLVKRNIKEEQE